MNRPILTCYKFVLFAIGCVVAWVLTQSAESAPTPLPEIALPLNTSDQFHERELPPESMSSDSKVSEPARRTPPPSVFEASPHTYGDPVAALQRERDVTHGRGILDFGIHPRDYQPRGGWRP